MPKKIIELYMKKLPSILTLFGYDNVNDFLEDYHYNSFTNKWIKKYIKENL